VTHKGWINYYSSFMLRLGHIKAVVSFADVSESSDPSELKHMLFDRLGEWKHTITCGASRRLQALLMDHYTSKTLTEQGLTYQEGKGLIGSDGKPVTEFALQDLYIFDEKMPSNLGTLTRKNFEEIVKWATSLGLLERETYRLTPKGLLLRRLIQEKGEIESFERFSIGRNPYILDDEKILFLYVLLDQDGYVLRRLLPKLQNETQGEFDSSLGGEILCHVLREIYETEHLDYEDWLSLQQLVSNLQKQISREREVRELRSKAELCEEEYKKKRELFEEAERRGDPELRKIEHEMYDCHMKMQDAHEELGKASRGIARVGVKEMRASPRLELLVDLGLLSKKKGVEDRRGQYHYYLNDQTRRFTERISSVGDIGHFLRSSFFDFVNYIYAYDASRTSDDRDIVTQLSNGYDAMKNPFGLAEIEDAVLFAVISQLGSRKSFFEIEDATETLKRVSGQRPRAISTHVDSYGQIRTFALRKSELGPLQT